MSQPEHTPEHKVLPDVTVLIAAKPDQVVIPAVAAAAAFRYPPGKLEILVVRGHQPSLQRNTGLRAATGELIYFLDDDSLPDPSNLERAVPQFSDPAVALVGGPNLCPGDAPFKERAFAAVTASWLGFGPSRARYMPLGKRRPSGEKELILCNLVARKSALLEVGGFNEALYPNEENALMDQLKARGWKMIYDPDIIVYRRPRQNLPAFARMIFRYGRGRAEQFRVNPTAGSLPNLVPPLFCAYLILLPLLGGKAAFLLTLYCIALLVQWLVLAPQVGWAVATAAAPLIVLAHLSYGIGFWYGLTTKLAPPKPHVIAEIRLERVRPIADSATPTGPPSTPHAATKSISRNHNHPPGSNDKAE